MEEKTPKEKIIESFQSLLWPEMVFTNNKITCPAGEIVSFEGKKTEINFIYYIKAENKYEKRNNRQVLILDNKVDPLSILRFQLNRGYDIQWFDYIKDILNIDSTFTKIKIVKTGKKS